MLRKAISLVGASALLLSLVGCSYSKESTEEDQQLSVSEIEVNGKMLTCVIYKDDYPGGVSCDWEGYHK